MAAAELWSLELRLKLRESMLLLLLLLFMVERLCLECGAKLPVARLAVTDFILVKKELDCQDADFR